MRLPADLQVGVATHTGRVRRGNEDDYLLLMPRAGEPAAWRLIVIADGMGGVTGGGEASRAAVRALGAAFLRQDGPKVDLEACLRQGFAAACQRVFELSRQSQSLRGMGTTLTAVALAGELGVLAHIGDSRCYLLRGGQLVQLTEDHAVPGENRLTRCVGGGRATEDVDLQELELRADDRLLLLTDGIWEAVPEPELLRALALRPQAAAEEMVRLANRNGGQDNGTALVVQIARGSGAHEVAFPAFEQGEPVLLAPAPGLRAPRWPWIVLLLSAALLGLAVAKAGLGVDALGWLLR